MKIFRRRAANKNTAKGVIGIYDAVGMDKDIARATQSEDLKHAIDDTLAALLSFGTNPTVYENCVDMFGLTSKLHNPKTFNQNTTTRHYKVMALCDILADAAEAKRGNKNIMPDNHVKAVGESFIDIAKAFPPVKEMKDKYEKTFFERMGEKFRLKKTDKGDKNSAMINIMSRLDEKSK